MNINEFAQLKVEVENIKQHLAKVVGGKLRYDSDCGYIISDESLGFVFAQVRGWGHFVGSSALNLPRDEAVKQQDINGEFIAKAPEYITVLLKMIDYLKRSA